MGEHDLGASNAGSAGADNNNLDGICALVDNSQRIAEGSKRTIAVPCWSSWIALLMRATPGVYAIERSSRLLSGIL
jgi:hypothetical protein